MNCKNSDSTSENESFHGVFSKKCLDCENYKRKVKEAQCTVSGRDVLIEMLQEEIKKMEERYKTSIDDYELLRFKYCTTVQDLGNLHEIHKKLEKSSTKIGKERDNTRNEMEILKTEIIKWKNECKELKQKLMSYDGDSANVNDSPALHQNILKEVKNIELIMQNQNDTVKGVLTQVLNEVQGVKNSKISEVSQKTTSCDANSFNIKDQGKEELVAIITELNDQIKTLNILIEQLKIENESIKNQLTEKKTSLAQCLNVLEDNHSNISDLSKNIEIMINEKENFLNEISRLKMILDENTRLFAEKDNQIYELKLKLDSMSEGPNGGNCKEDNKSLHKALNQCQTELKRLKEDYMKVEKCNFEKCEQLAKVMLQTKSAETYFTKVVKQNELGAAPNPALIIKDTEMYPSSNKQIKDTSNDVENDVILLLKKIAALQGEKNVYEEKLKKLEGIVKKNDKTDEYLTQITSLNEKVKSLENDMEQAKLENYEYEEENKYYVQKIEGLTLQLQLLENEKVPLENNNFNNQKIEEMKQEFEQHNLKKDIIIKELEKEVSNLQNIQGDVNITKLTEEKTELEKQLNTLENELTFIQQKDEKHILSLQDKIEELEQSYNEKQKEISECYCTVSGIKDKIIDKTLTEANTLNKIKVLEDQKGVLEKDNQILKQQFNILKNELADIQRKCKDCDCRSGKHDTNRLNMEACIKKLQKDIKQLEVELCRRDCINEKLHNEMKEMETEICRRQCTVNHLEQCLDKSNKILAECEREMKNMHAENELIKKDNEILNNELRNYIVDVERSTAEKHDLQEKVTKITRQSQELQLEKYQLTQNLQDKTGLENKLIQLSKQYNNVVQTLRERDAQLEETKKQMETLNLALENEKREFELDIQRYYEQTQGMNIKEKQVEKADSQQRNCNTYLEIKKLRSKLIEKENIIKTLEIDNCGLAAEVAELGVYVDKVITENKNLRMAIENLLSALVEKLKNFTRNENKICLKSNELIVEDILNSLIALENDVMMISTATSTEKCNCMSVIMSTYRAVGKESKSEKSPPCKMKCGKKMKETKVCNAQLAKNMVDACEKCCETRENRPDQYYVL